MRFFDGIINLFRGTRPSAAATPTSPAKQTDEERLRSVLGRLSYDTSDLPRGIRQFQRLTGLQADGIAGQKTMAKVAEYEGMLERAPKELGQLRKWRMTRYFVADEVDYPGAKVVPMLDPQKKTIKLVSAGFFANAALEGTGRLEDGRLVNVAGKQYVDVDPAQYKPCLSLYLGYVERMKAAGRTPKPGGYFGISIGPDGVRRAQPFRIVPEDRLGVGYGIGRGGIPYTPHETVAADIGAYPRSGPGDRRYSDPRFAGKGGLVPVGTRVYLLEAGKWVTVNDTGGGIFGAHFDLFVGNRSLDKDSNKQAYMHVWFPGIEDRVPADYEHGLYDS